LCFPILTEKSWVNFCAVGEVIGSGLSSTGSGGSELIDCFFIKKSHEHACLIIGLSANCLLALYD
jgi:hypothetical protein